jgi:hypothetical protein
MVNDTPQDTPHAVTWLCPTPVIHWQACVRPQWVEPEEESVALWSVECHRLLCSLLYIYTEAGLQIAIPLQFSLVPQYG